MPLTKTSCWYGESVYTISLCCDVVKGRSQGKGMSEGAGHPPRRDVTRAAAADADADAASPLLASLGRLRALPA
jgi:hypothetical protein